MKYKLNRETEIMLNTLKGKILMASSSNKVGLLCIDDFTITEEEEIIRHTFRSDETIKVKYLTSITMYSYHHDGKFIGTLTDDSVKNYLILFNLYYFRQAWVDFREQLRAFDLDVTEIKKESSSNYTI
jgi:hypothetical protein